MALTLTDRATMDEIVSWQDSFLSEHSGRNLQRQPEHINTMMRTYLGKMRSNMATILKAMPPLANKLARKISVIVHFFYQCRTNYRFSQGNHNLWEFLDHMTEVLAFYCDIRIHGFMVYNERAVDVSHGILTMLKLYLEENHVSIVNVLIRMTRHRHSKTIFEQIFQDVEKDAPLAQSRRSPITYCRYLLFYRQWKRMYKELHILQKMSLQASEKLKVPPGFRAHPLFDLIKPGPIVPPNITLYLLSTNIRTNEAAEKFFGYLKARNMMDESDLICESEEVLEVIDLTDEPGSPPKEEIEDVEEVYDLVPEVCSVETMTNQFQETVTTAGGESSSSAQVVPIISTLNEGEIVIADSENMAPISKEPQQTRPQDTDSIDAGYSDRSVSDLCENSPSYEIEPHEGQAACPNYWHKPPVAQANVEKIPSHVDAATSCSTNETLGGIPKSHCSETPPNAPVQNADNVGFPNSTVIQPTLNQKTTATSTTQTVDIDEGISPMEVETASSAVESVVNSDMVSATDDTHRQKMTQTADASRISEIVPKPAEVLPTTPTVPIQQINLSSIPCCSCGGEKSKSVETVSSVMTEIFTKLNTDTTLSENNSANSNPEIYTLKTKEPITNSKHIPGESLITDVISDNVNVEVSSQVHNSEPVDNIFNQGSGAVATEEQCPKIAPQSDSISASLPINNSVLQSVVNEEPTPAAATSPLRNTPSPTDQLFIDCVLSNDIERSNKPRENLKRVDQISYATPKSVSASPQKYTDFCGFRNNQVLYASSDPDMHSQSSHNCTVHLSAITAKAQQTRAYLENSSKRMVVTRPYEQFTGTIEDGYGRKIKIKPILKTNRNPIKNVAKKVNITGEVLQKNIFVEEEQPIVYDTMLTSTTGKEYKFNSRINRIEKHRSLISMQNYYPKTSRETTGTVHINYSSPSTAKAKHQRNHTQASSKAAKRKVPTSWTFSANNPEELKFKLSKAPCVQTDSMDVDSPMNSWDDSNPQSDTNTELPKRKKQRSSNQSRKETKKHSSRQSSEDRVMFTQDKEETPLDILDPNTTYIITTSTKNKKRHVHFETKSAKPRPIAQSCEALKTDMSSLLPHAPKSRKIATTLQFHPPKTSLASSPPQTCQLSQSPTLPQSSAPPLQTLSSQSAPILTHVPVFSQSPLLSQTSMRVQPPPLSPQTNMITLTPVCPMSQAATLVGPPSVFQPNLDLASLIPIANSPENLSIDKSHGFVTPYPPPLSLKPQYYSAADVGREIVSPPALSPFSSLPPDNEQLVGINVTLASSQVYPNLTDENSAFYRINDELECKADKSDGNKKSLPLKKRQRKDRAELIKSTEIEIPSYPPNPMMSVADIETEFDRATFSTKAELKSMSPHHLYLDSGASISNLNHNLTNENYCPLSRDFRQVVQSSSTWPIN